MTPAKSIAVAVTAAGLVGAVAVFVTLRLVPKQDGVSSTEFAAMQAELAAVRAQGARQGAVLGQVVRAGAMVPQVEARSPAEGVPAAPPPVEAKVVKEATAEVLAEHFGETFASEAADPAWSQVAEGTVSREIVRRLPDGSSVQSIQCRRSMCQLQSSHTNMDTYQKFADDALLGRETGLWNGAVTTLVVGTSGAGVKSISYIAREGHDLPSLEAPN